MRKHLDKEYVIAMLRDAIEAAGSERKFAQMHGLSNTTVNYVVRGKIEPYDGVLKALGLRRVTSYERV